MASQEDALMNQYAMDEYTQALKQGQREYRERVSA